MVVSVWHSTSLTVHMLVGCLKFFICVSSWCKVKLARRISNISFSACVPNSKIRDLFQKLLLLSVFTSAVAYKLPMQALVLLEHRCLSIRPSVHLSVTLWYCIKTNNFWSPSRHDFFTDGEAEDFRFWSDSFIPSSKGVTPSEGNLWDWGGNELAIFDL